MTSEKEYQSPGSYRHAWELVQHAPISVWVAALFVAVLAIFQLAIGLWQVTNGGLISLNDMQSAETVAEANVLMGMTRWFLCGLLTLITFTQVTLCIKVIRGSQKARKLILALLTLSFIGTAMSVSTNSAEGGNLYAIFIIMASHVFAMLEFTSDGAVNYTYNITSNKRIRKSGLS